jgi:hypothetical protein
VTVLLRIPGLGGPAATVERHFGEVRVDLVPGDEEQDLGASLCAGAARYPDRVQAWGSSAMPPFTPAEILRAA